MSGKRALPRGFVEHREHGHVLIAAAARLTALREAGLADPATWERLLADAAGRRTDERPAGRAAAGRGSTALLALPGGQPLMLKKMRRGGLTAVLWRDRYPGVRRLLANLAVPLEARRRGVPTAAPVALLMRPASLGLYEGWLATEAVEGAEDLLTRLRRPPPPDTAEIVAVARTVRRMHDAGVEHRDLNLGNLLLRSRSNAPEGFVIDLDRARLRPDPLPLRPRRAALRRLERSYAKHFGEGGPLGKNGAARLYELYAGQDAELARRLRAGRRAARALLALHRLGWPR